MLNKTKLSMIALGALSSLLVACNNGGSTSTYQYLQVVPYDPANNPVVFAANIGESTTVTFATTLVSNAGSSQTKYNIMATIPNGSFTIFTESGNNGCQQVSANTTCYITIQFAPASQSDYSLTNSLQFTVGALESTINAITEPR